MSEEELENLREEISHYDNDSVTNMKGLITYENIDNRLAQLKAKRLGAGNEN